ncbi:hypothetical protein J4482_01640 [Candidatus Woesearchaeota archaeon]|nr:hypothetical protein [uncultured archaeon]AQS31350.1 hypothetical protein [uncultured archaeon]AQS32119.1 hypothetical protein [uncultured archaeon]MBS3115310.1 hypothetical protein [Candidatus Woesearchaeota archaeon]
MSTATQPELKEFYASSADTALRDLQDAHYKPLFMPGVIDARLADENLFKTWLLSTSMRATGKTKQCSGVVIYAHIPNYFSNPANIRKAIDQGLVNYAVKVPQEEFDRLVKLAEKGAKGVHIVPYETLKKAASGYVPLDEALAHPQTIPFCNGKERAEKYVPKVGEVYNTKTIGIWHSDDLYDQPVARLLYVGGVDDDGLYGFDYFYDIACFLGVRSSASAVSASQQNSKEPRESTYSQIMRMVRPLVTKRNHGKLEERVRKQF